MAIGRDVLGHLERLVQPMKNRLANAITRSIVKLVNDGAKLQLLQLGGLQVDDAEGREIIEDAEHFQPFGFYSVPLAGAEAITICPNGDRGHPLVIVAADRRYRPTGRQGGEAGLYNTTAARVMLLPSGAIEIQPAAGQEVFIRSNGGSSEPLVKKSEFDNHTHPNTGLTAGGNPVTGVPNKPAAATGTTKLQAE